MKLVFVLGFLACGSAGDYFTNELKALKNLIQSQKNGNPLPWTNATCSAPPAFCKTADDLNSKQRDDIISVIAKGLQIFISRLDSDTSSWSIWPPLGCLLNSGNYLNLSSNHAFIYLRKQNGEYNATCSVLNGELEKPKWTKVDNEYGDYVEVGEKAVQLVAEDSEVRVKFNWGDCNNKPNNSTMVYKLSDKKMFEGWINQISKARQFQGESPQDRQAFMIAAPQNVDKNSFLMMGVSRSNANAKAIDCDLDWFAVYNADTYSKNMTDYVDTYFGEGLVTVGLFNDCLKKAKKCSGPPTTKKPE